jgi:arylsulfatase A-like enzyme
MHPLRSLLCLLALSVAATVNRATQPNILVMLADDLGAMDLGCYKPDTFYETPHLDRLAQQGVRFTQGYAANPVCSPSRYALATGRHPTRGGITNWIPGPRVERFLGAEITLALPSADPTLAEILRAQGYRTGFAGKWHLGDDPAVWPEARGFEINHGGYSAGQPKSWFSPYGNPRLQDGPPGEYLTDRLADETCRMLEAFKAARKPFYISHCFYQVHTPLRAPQPLVDKYRAKAARLGLQERFGDEEQTFVSDSSPRRVRLNQTHPVFAAMVEAMDTAAGRILRKLDELGLAENTLVVFTSDNGGLSTAEGHATSNLPLRGGKGWIYEGGIRVPFLVRWPGVARANTLSEVPVVTHDIVATALAAAGAAPDPGRVLDGRDFTPALRGAASLERDALFWHYPHNSNQGGFPGGAVRMGDWKLIERYEDGRVHLFNLRTDGGEQHDLAARELSRVQAMRAQLHAWYRETGARFLRAKVGGPAPWSPLPHP